MKTQGFIIVYSGHFVTKSVFKYTLVTLHTSIGPPTRWSFGIARGKNDVVDAIRLCKYACKESEELKMTKPLNPKLMQRNAARLKDLQTSRTRLLSQKNGNQVYLKELNDINRNGEP